MQKLDTSFPAHNDYVMDMLVIDHFSSLVTCSLDKTIKMWDMRVGKLQNTKTGHSKGITKLAHCKTYRQIISAGCEKDFYAWSDLVNKPIHKFVDHAAPVIGVHAFENTPEIVSVDVQGHVYIWDV